ncbi:MAG: hypothetical protein Q8K78_18850 [Planctomycetaceae bacterium]|nr:hypothetical protein [Planctomycetaceae bacterium]
MPRDLSIPADRRALKVLFDTYWTSAGWRDERSRSTPPEDLEYAKQAGVMFDPIRLSHDDIVKRAVAAVRGVKRQAVADAFIVSLSSRRLDLRSALGSFAVFQHFALHPVPGIRLPCPECGEYDGKPKAQDLNVLNFERLKWGGVRHDQPLYAAIDLELFRQLPGVAPTAADVAIFKGVLKAIEASPVKTSSAVLQKSLAQAVKSSKAERDVLVGILGYCGILATPAHPGFLSRFVPWSERDLPDRRFVDMAYPACWWQSADGINAKALAYWFGHVL